MCVTYVVAHGVMVTIMENRFSNPSSNPRQGCLQTPLEKI